MNQTILFVHGAWLTSLSWENLIGHFEGRGFTCVAPEWPYRDKSVPELRANTPPELADYMLNWLQDQKLSEGAEATAAA
jgi:hypothetical protein